MSVFSFYLFHVTGTSTYKYILLINFLYGTQINVQNVQHLVKDQNFYDFKSKHYLKHDWAVERMGLVMSFH